MSSSAPAAAPQAPRIRLRDYRPPAWLVETARLTFDLHPDGRHLYISNEEDATATVFDIQTGELLGRFIAEERDSERLLSACYHAICEGTKDKETTEASLQDLGQRLDRLSETLEELKQLRRQ